MAAFRATLEEVLSADLILHVRDISHPDSDAQKHDVETVLDELGIDAEQRAARMLEVWNKFDLLAPDELATRPRPASAGDVASWSRRPRAPASSSCLTSSTAASPSPAR